LQKHFRSLISVNNISKEFGGEVLFSNITFNINPKERIGLAGKNGVGKTTLLKIMAGELRGDGGDVVIPDGLKLGYLPQEKSINSLKTVLEETLHVFDFLEHYKEELEIIHRVIDARNDFESKEYQRLLEKQAGLMEQIRISEPEKIRGKAERILTGLGFGPNEFHKPISQFSFGWQMRVELARLLLLNPDLLMLDEPTNHLDIESIQWLEDFLEGYGGSVLMVSHDRTLLDRITTRTLEISNGKIYDYKVPWSKYVQLREERLGHQMAAFNNQQKQIRQIEHFIERFRYKNTKARQVQSRIKHLEKMEKIQIDDLDNEAIHFTFPPAPHSGKITVSGKSITKSYGQLKVLNAVDFEILKGEKIAFVGKNGEGKTTLARIIAGQLQHEGELKPGHNVITGYYSQDQWEMLDPEKTVFDTLDDVAVGEIRKKLKTILGSFLFQGEDVNKKVKVLSGGEKSRLALAKLLLIPGNLLILDEPTNHLDILSKDILKNALLQYNGTLIIVSHDRDFLQGLTSRLYEFRNKKIKEFRGDIFDFLEKRRINTLAELEQKEKKDQKKTGSRSKSKTSWEQKKERERKARKVENAISRIEKQISELEDQLKVINEKLSKPDEYTKEIKSGELYKQHSTLTDAIEDSYHKWEVRHAELEPLKP